MTRIRTRASAWRWMSLAKRTRPGEYFAEAEKLDPNGYLTVANVGWHKMHIGEYAEAKRYFDRVSPPDDPSTPENEIGRMVSWRIAPKKSRGTWSGTSGRSYLPYIAGATPGRRVKFLRAGFFAGGWDSRPYLPLSLLLPVDLHRAVVAKRQPQARLDVTGEHHSD